jgi:hypothetical protein
MNGRTDPRKVLLHPYLFLFPINSSSAQRQVVESRDPALTLNISIYPLYQSSSEIVSNFKLKDSRGILERSLG